MVVVVVVVAVIGGHISQGGGEAHQRSLLFLGFGEDAFLAHLSLQHMPWGHTPHQSGFSVHTTQNNNAHLSEGHILSFTMPLHRLRMSLAKPATQPRRST